MVARKTVTYKISGPITLGDLRKFVENLEKYDASNTVRITEHKSYSPVEHDPETISVTITEPL
jgi:hypothetical protein